MQVGRSFTKTFAEHGCILGMFSIRADLKYQQRLPREFRRETRYDFYWPDLALLGEQEVLSSEVYADGSGDPDLGTGDWSVWGYQPRYEEYRRRTNEVSGLFRSNHAQSLDVWHLALDFASRPTLNDAFLEEDPPVNRVIQVITESQFKVDVHFKVRAVRPIPRRATPGLMRI
jgi:hypothetical protein